MFQFSTSTLNLYRRLFDLTDTFAKERPWTHMGDAEVVNVLDPVTEEVSQCVVMGQAGEVFGLAAYIGEAGRAIYDSVILYDDPWYDPAEDGEIINREWWFYMQNTLKLELVGQEEVDDFHRQLYRELNLSFSGSTAYPVFQRMRSGYLPESELSEEELIHLADCIEQCLEVHRMLAAGDDPAQREGPFSWYVRMRGTDGEWVGAFRDREDAYAWAGLPEPRVPDGLFDFTQKEVDKGRFSQGILVMPMPSVAEEGRPFFPMLVIFLDFKTGRIEHQELLTPEELSESFNERVCAFFRQKGKRPSRMVAADLPTAILLEKCSEGLKTDLHVEPELEIFTTLRQSLLSHFFGDMDK